MHFLAVKPKKFSIIEHEFKIMVIFIISGYPNIMSNVFSNNFLNKE